MVKILANGEIVPDDDPRARSAPSNNARQRPQFQRGGIPHTDNQQRQGGQQGSIFQTINQTLLGYGIPRWSVGDRTIEPVVSVGLVLAVVFFGIQGLLIGVLLFMISQWSTNGPPDFVARFLGTQQSQGSAGNTGGGGGRDRRGGGGGGGGGSGNRLGHN